MNKIAKYLNQHLVGNVFDRAEILEKYAIDRSIIKIEPKMVVVPDNVNDVRRVVRFVNQLAAKGYELKLAVRGSGLDKTGADLSPDIVISTEKMNQIQELDERSRLLRVQAGATLGAINHALGFMGLTIPVNADPRETIGALISNNTDDIYSYVDCIEAVVSTGDVLQTTRISKRVLNQKEGLTSTEGAIYRDVSGLIEDNFDIVSDIANKEFFDNTGYPTIADVYHEKGGSFDLTPLFFGAQGTLGVITEVILRCEPDRETPTRFAAAFNSVETALEYAEVINTLGPASLDFFDARIFKKSASVGKDPHLFSDRFHNGYIVLAAFDDPVRKTRRKLAKCLKNLPKSAAAVAETEENVNDFKRIDYALASFLNDDLRGERAPILDDFKVPFDQLADFIKDLKTSEETYGTLLPLYGSLTTDTYSVRPDLRLNAVDGRQLALKLIKDFAQILAEYSGSLTGGGPEGRTKAIAMQLSENEAELYERLKDIFDPHRILNPDAKLGASLKSVVKTLRTTYNSGITS